MTSSRRRVSEKEQNSVKSPCRRKFKQVKQEADEHLDKPDLTLDLRSRIVSRINYESNTYTQRTGFTREVKQQKNNKKENQTKSKQDVCAINLPTIKDGSYKKVKAAVTKKGTRGKKHKSIQTCEDVTENCLMMKRTYIDIGVQMPENVYRTVDQGVQTTQIVGVGVVENEVCSLHMYENEVSVIIDARIELSKEEMYEETVGSSSRENDKGHQNMNKDKKKNHSNEVRSHEQMLVQHVEEDSVPSNIASTSKVDVDANHSLNTINTVQPNYLSENIPAASVNNLSSQMGGANVLSTAYPISMVNTHTHYPVGIFQVPTNVPRPMYFPNSLESYSHSVFTEETRYLHSTQIHHQLQTVPTHTAYGYSTNAVPYGYPRLVSPQVRSYEIPSSSSEDEQEQT